MAPPAETRDIARLVVSCPDRPGIVAAVSRFLAARGANIVTSDQYSTDPQGGTFLMRMTVYLPGLSRDAAFEADFATQVAADFEMDWRIWPLDRRRWVTIMVSRHDHCLLDLLWRWRRGELEMDVRQVISNHPDLRGDVEALGIPYHHVPVTTATKQDAERTAARLIAGSDLVILARAVRSHLDDRVLVDGARTVVFGG